MAENDASRVTLGTVPGTVPGAVRKACSEALQAAICGRNLAVRGSVTCRFVRKEACRSIRTASPQPMCRAKGKVVVKAIRAGTAGVACGGTSGATFVATGAMTVLGLGTRSGKTGRQSLGAPASFHEEAKRGRSLTGAKWGQSHGALASDSARYSPHLRGTVPVFPGSRPRPLEKAEAGQGSGF